MRTASGEEMAAQWSKLPEAASPPPRPSMDLVRHVDGAISLDDESSLLSSCVSERRGSRPVPHRKRVVLTRVTSSDIDKCITNIVGPRSM